MLQILLIGALALDSILLTHALGRIPIAGCGGAEGCDSVLASNWGYFLQLPVSLFALPIHAGLLASMSIRREKLKQGLWRAAGIAFAVAILLAAGWFMLVQAVILGHYCRLCMADHVLGVIVATVFLQTLPRGQRLSEAAGGVSIAVLVMGVLIAGQHWFPLPDSATGTLAAPIRAVGSDRLVTIFPDAPPLPLSELPHWGDAGAPTTIIVLFDFTCPNCRKVDGYLHQALKQYGARLCVVLLPVPIAPGCNPYIANLLPEHADACAYAKLALALWRRSPDDFRAFCSRFVTPGSSAEPIDVARQWAAMRIGKEGLNQALVDPWIKVRVHQDVEIFARLVKSSGRVELPKMVAGSKVVSGAPADYAQFDQILRGMTGLQ